MGRTFNRGMAPDAIEVKNKILERLKSEHKMKSYSALKRFKLVLKDIDNRKTGAHNAGHTLFNSDGSPSMVIVINKYLTLETMYVVVRHELLHNILSHVKRQLEILKNYPLTYPDGTPIMVKKPGDTSMKQSVRLVKIIDYAMNIAQDLDLSLYMDKDEIEIARDKIQFYRKPRPEELEAAENAVEWANYLLKEGQDAISYTTGGYVWDDPQWRQIENMTLDQILDEVLRIVNFTSEEEPPAPPTGGDDEGDDSDDDSGEGGSGGGQRGGGDDNDREVVVVYGTYVDPYTFIDENGNEVELVEW